MDDQNANPFTVPVGILLYRVARNMWIGQKSHRKKMNVIHKLLFNCLQLLDAYKYSQVRVWKGSQVRAWKWSQVRAWKWSQVRVWKRSQVRVWRWSQGGFYNVL